MMCSLILIVGADSISRPRRSDSLDALYHIIADISCLGSIIRACEFGSMLELCRLVKIAGKLNSRLMLVAVVNFI